MRCNQKYVQSNALQTKRTASFVVKYRFFARGQTIINNIIFCIETKLDALIFHLAKLEIHLIVISRMRAYSNRALLTETPCRNLSIMVLV